MRKYFLKIPSFFSIMCMSSVALGDITYGPAKITNLQAASGGIVYIRFDGLPARSSCGTQDRWVQIPPAEDAMKTLAISLYFSGKVAVVTTGSCAGAFETVIYLSTPSN